MYERYMRKRNYLPYIRLANAEIIILGNYININQAVDSAGLTHKLNKL